MSGSWRHHVSAAYVSAGGYHTCSLGLDHRVTCWGRNVYGQAESPDESFSQISAGLWHSCGILFSPGGDNHDTVHCWGHNSHGQSIPATGRFSKIASGGLHSCALRKSDSSITCWGSNRYGQLNAPEGPFIELTTGGDHSCGLRSRGKVECWGSNDDHQLDIPHHAVELATQISAGETHVCALRNHSVACWGSNAMKQSESPDNQTIQIESVTCH